MSWSRAFHIPISLPDGRMRRTLRDAVNWDKKSVRVMGYR